MYIIYCIKEVSIDFYNLLNFTFFRCFVNYCVLKLNRRGLPKIMLHSGIFGFQRLILNYNIP